MSKVEVWLNENTINPEIASEGEPFVLDGKIFGKNRLQQSGVEVIHRGWPTHRVDLRAIDPNGGLLERNIKPGETHTYETRNYAVMIRHY